MRPSPHVERDAIERANRAYVVALSLLVVHGANATPAHLAAAKQAYADVDEVQVICHITTTKAMAALILAHDMVASWGIANQAARDFLLAALRLYHAVLHGAGFATKQESKRRLWWLDDGDEVAA